MRKISISMLAFAAVIGFAGAANAAADSVTAKSYVDSLYAANKGAISSETTRATGVEGALSSLTTDEKGSLVGAINEVDGHADTAQTAANSAQSTADAVTKTVGTIVDGTGIKAVVGTATVAANLDKLDVAIKTEKDRAEAVEGDRSKLTAFTNGFFYNTTDQKPLDLANAIVTENERATTVEGDINSKTTGLKHFTVDGDLKGQDLATAINSTYDKAISEASDAKSYADQVAAAAKTTAEATAATKANAALETAKSYADSVASTAQQSAESTAATKADAAEKNAKDYADGLAKNYDAAGSAATAEKNAKDYADDEIDNLDADVNSQTNKDKNGNLIITNVDATVTEVDGVITKVESELNVDGCTEGQVVVYKRGKLVCQSVVAYDATQKKYYAEDAASTTYDDYKMGGNY